MNFAKHINIFQEIVVGLTVSAVALSLGGAFGLLSGRGVLVGMLSAAIYPLITSAFGGTRVQCSGPTGPMTAALVALTVSASASLPEAQQPLLSAFVNMTMFLTAVLLLLAGVLRLGNWISIVPNVAISGFMDGIALIIWISQLKKLFHIGPQTIDGPVVLNVLLAAATLALSISVTRMARVLPSRLAAVISGTLVAFIVMTLFSMALDLPVGRAVSDVSLHSWGDVSVFFSQNSPGQWPWHLIALSLPLAVQLTGVAYLDTLLTSLIIDRQRGEKSQRNRELGVQGMATALVSLMGGIPGAQATERSVLMLKEGARTRLAGVLVGVFGLVGVLLLQDVVSQIPKAVFAGVLLKVGYDVFDWQPLIVSVRQWRQRRSRASWQIVPGEAFIILVTALLTVAIDLVIAVVIGTAMFRLLQKRTKGGLKDLRLGTDTEGFTDEP